jgi:hypothetical protein
MVEGLLENLSLLTTSPSVLSRKKQNTMINSRYTTYYYDKRIGMIM